MLRTTVPRSLPAWKMTFGWLIKRIQETWLLTVCCQQASLAWQRDRLFKIELSLQLRSVEAITDIACVLPSGAGPSGIQVHSPFALWGRSDPCSLLSTGHQDSVSAQPLPPRWQQVCPTAATQFSERDRCRTKLTTFLPEEFLVLGKKLPKEVIPHTVVNASLYLAMNFSNTKIRAEPGSVMRCLTVAQSQAPGTHICCMD